jgi:hypothetical protein
VQDLLDSVCFLSFLCQFKGAKVREFPIE